MILSDAVFAKKRRKKINKQHFYGYQLPKEHLTEEIPPEKILKSTIKLYHKIYDEDL